ncbi:MAG: STAS domain-containing protein [Acidimicrobiia bacterium]
MTNAGAAPASASGNFRVSTDEQGDWTVLRVVGEVDVYTSPALRDELYRVIDSGTPRVALDLSGMEFIDSSGLGVFVGALKRVRERSGELELRGVQPSTRKVLDITGLVQVFTIVA